MSYLIVEANLCSADKRTLSNAQYYFLQAVICWESATVTATTASTTNSVTPVQQQPQQQLLVVTPQQLQLLHLQVSFELSIFIA